MENQQRNTYILLYRYVLIEYTAGISSDRDKDVLRQYTKVY